MTIDAMGTQTKIVEKIIGKKADYCISLKGNQSKLHDNARQRFDMITNSNTKTVEEKDHGRIEGREYFLETNTDWLPVREKWVGLAAVGMVKSTITAKAKTTEDT